MTLEQALNFQMPNGKALKDMSPEDWGLELKRIRKEQKRRDALWEAGLLSAEEDQRCHAVADRYEDLISAIQVTPGTRP